MSMDVFNNFWIAFLWWQSSRSYLHRVIIIIIIIIIIFCISSNEPDLRGRDWCYQVAMKVVSYLIFME